jgi:hypothetical protein
MSSTALYYVPSFTKRKTSSLEPSDNPLPLYKENYRGFAFAAYGCVELDAARRNIDRIWSKRLFDAPNAKARVAILAEERALSQQFDKRACQKKKASNEEEIVG